MVTCSFCERKAVYYKEYEGNFYCKKHFIESFEKKVKWTIRKFKLIEKGDKVAVALSGGKDSSALLYVLYKFFKNNPKIKIFAISIDEGIKEHRDIAIEKAKELTELLGVEHYIFSFKDEFEITIDEIDRMGYKNHCTFCGTFRRYLLNKKAREIGATKLAVALTLDDEAQSGVMNLVRGDVKRMNKIGPSPYKVENKKFIPRIKPFALIPEREVALYSNLLNLPFALTSCPYSKFNKLRFATKDFLNTLEENHPGISFSVVYSSIKLGNLITQKLGKVRIGYCVRCGEPSAEKVCRTCQLLSKIKK